MCLGATAPALAEPVLTGAGYLEPTTRYGHAVLGDGAQPAADLWPLFDALKGLPLCCIRGKNSDLLSAETYAEMCKRRPDMVAVEVPGRGHVPFLDFKSMIKAAPALAKQQAWRSVYSVVSSYVDNEKLREALSFHTLLVGGNPMKTSSIYALIHKLEMDGGVWWAKGGTNRLIAGMVRHFERLGGTMRVGDPVVGIDVDGKRAKSVMTQSGHVQGFDAVASNADIMHSYKDLLSGSKRGADYSRSLSRKSFSPSLFVVHFGIEGSWPGIPHHMILFGPRYEGLLDDIYKHGVLPRDFSIYLHHPSKSDPSMAPPGMSTFYALVPVAHMGKLAVDWEEMGPVLEKRILDELGRRLIPDIHSRIVTKFHYAPRDFAADLNAHMGSAFSLEPVLTQSAYFRGHNRDDVIKNFYLVGAGTHPGAGIPGVVGSAKATAGLMVEDLVG